MKFLHRFFIASLLLATSLFLEPAQKFSSRFASATKKMTPEDINTAWFEAIKTMLKKHSQDTYNQIHKAYSTIFEHPLYTKFYEPVAVGHKAKDYGSKFINTLQQSNEPSHNFMDPYTEKYVYNQFHDIIYTAWKNRLTPQELLQHQKAINDYEKAYRDYNNNPLSVDNHEELLHQTQRIYQRLNDYPASISIETSEPIFEH